MKYAAFFKEDISRIENYLEHLLPPETARPARLHQAMRYAVLGGGKRFRPVLTLAAAEAAGLKGDLPLIPAGALELIHCYSLVQDDLPALDNDDERRGRPTCHRQFDEATAILASDGLLTLALQSLAAVRPAETACRLLEEISTSSGTYGMIGGQAEDLGAEADGTDLPGLDYICVHKTGKLIKSAAACGAIAAGAGPAECRKLIRFGECLGLAFQLVDDLLDGDGYLRYLNPRDVEANARDLIAQAKREIKPFGDQALRLLALADFLIERIPDTSHA